MSERIIRAALGAALGEVERRRVRIAAAGRRTVAVPMALGAGILAACSAVYGAEDSYCNPDPRRGKLWVERCMDGEVTIVGACQGPVHTWYGDPCVESYYELVGTFGEICTVSLARPDGATLTHEVELAANECGGLSDEVVWFDGRDH